MNVLGIYNGHNATAALLKDGRIVACVSEERFSGCKNQAGFPAQSIRYCLSAAGLEPGDLDAVGIGYQYSAPVFASEPVRQQHGIRLLRFAYGPARAVWKAWENLEYRIPALRPVSRIGYDACALSVGRYSTWCERKFTAQFLGIPAEKVFSYDHHLIHAVTAYYGSPYNRQDAVLLTLDGEGDRLCGSVSEIRNGKYRRISETYIGNSLGWIYLDATRFLGMKGGEDEYKVMGLAPYAGRRGRERAYGRIQDIIRLDAKDPLRFRSKFDTHHTHRFLKEKMSGVRFDDVAAAVQMLLEERILEWVRNAVRRTGLKTVVAGGGVFMNVKANLRITELPEVERFFPFPTAGDESTPIGAAYWAALELSRKIGRALELEPLRDIYLGPDFTEAEAESALKRMNIAGRHTVSREEDIERRTAELLSENRVVARVSGRMEWGARSLGNRSILAHPADPDAARIINQMIKGRDFWMPFAPTLLAERAQDYVVNPKQIPAPYMAVCFHSTPRARRELKAALHPYDGTLRPQLVTPQQNASYHRLIKSFEEKTGVGGVLNTSYNLHGSPMVRGPQEALETFEKSGLPHLALGPYLISKKDGAHPSLPDAAPAHAHAG
ncbi:MAG: hypothetical protein HY594_05580 [Candidatus Omnitrophica bacterium]|nr:hypothetical protein [Candidatus Omnitrophota bacterium]